MKKIILIFSLVVLAGSCSIYRKYQRPENLLPVDSLYRDMPASAGAGTPDSSSLAYMPWEDLFTDTLLRNLINEGLENNTDLLTAALRVEQAQARLKASKWAYSPSLNLAPQGGYNYSLADNGGSTSASSSWTYNIGVSASWDIDLFGSLLNAKRGAQADLLQQQAYRQAVRSQLVATLANAYYTLLMLDEQVSISQENVALWKEQIRTMEALLRVGLTTENAVTQSRAQLYGLEATLSDLLRQRREAENAICTLLGSVSSSVERGTLSEQSLPDSVEVGLPLELLSNRPDVYQAEMALASAYYSANYARSAFYPKLTLSGSAGWTNSLGQAILNPGGLIVSALASLAQPIFNKGQLTSNLRVAKAEEEIAKLAYKQTLLNAGEEVNNALFAIQSYDEMMEKHLAQCADLERTVETSRYLYETNNATYLELLTAQQSLLNARLNVVSDRYLKLSSVVNLYRALGGGKD